MRFNKIKKSAIVVVLGLSLVQVAQAQTADARASFGAKLTANTCRLQLESGNNTSRGGINPLSVSLGNISVPANVTAALTPLGTPTTVTISLLNSSLSGPCTAVASDKSLFNILMDLKADQISTINSRNYRKNDSVSNATNAVMVINSGVANNSTTAPNLNLVPRQALTGTKIGLTNQAFNGSITLNLQLATAAAALPTTGNFTASIPLFLTYE